MESSGTRAAEGAGQGDAPLLDAGLLLLRIAVGGAFLRHGLRWILGPGLAAMGPAFARQGVPWVLADATAIVFITAEVVLGVAMIAGLWVRLAAALLILLMAFSFVILPHELTFPLSRGADSMVLLTTACAALLLSSGGRWSTSHVIRRALRGGVRHTAPETLT